MSHPETEGYAEVVNAYDEAWLSFGWAHWTLRANAGPAELCSLLAWYRWRYPSGYKRGLPGLGRDRPDLVGAPVATREVRDACRGARSYTRRRRRGWPTGPKPRTRPATSCTSTATGCGRSA